MYYYSGHILESLLSVVRLIIHQSIIKGLEQASVISFLFTV